MTKLLKTKLRFDAGSKAERTEQFRAATPLEVAFPSDPNEDFFARIDTWSVADIAFRDYELAPFMAGYDSKPTTDYGCVLTLSGTGRSKIWDGDRVFDVHPGCVHLAAGCMSLSTRVTGKLIFLPADVVEIPKSGTKPFVQYGAHSVGAKVLSASMRSMFESLADADADQAMEIERAIAGLVKTFFFNQQPNEDILSQVRAGQKRAMVEFVDQRCADPEFKVSELLASFHISRATLGRLFEDEGGAATYIINRRLDHALHALTTKPARRGRLAEVSEDVGFIDYGHFRRAFRRRFGFAPSDALALAPKAAPETL